VDTKLPLDVVKSFVSTCISGTVPSVEALPPLLQVASKLGLTDLLELLSKKLRSYACKHGRD